MPVHFHTAHSYLQKVGKNVFPKRFFFFVHHNHIYFFIYFRLEDAPQFYFCNLVQENSTQQQHILCIWQAEIQTSMSTLNFVSFLNVKKLHNQKPVLNYYTL